MKISKIIGVFLATASFSTFAHTDYTFTFTNQSQQTLSFAIDHVCSKQLGNIEKQVEKTITQADLTEVCANNPTHCAVDVYAQPDCADKPSGSIVFNQMMITSTTTDGKINIVYTGHFADIFLIFS